ncbi:nucleotidyl transferase AbiEii/AbiGii toxin family protein [Candidatus Uhrbacteria bacterium]|nr:nucleotidyl transferase AbiEii/AbiGii toxin family protein [Candidatus Uhrbacteria bacterium]
MSDILTVDQIAMLKAIGAQPEIVKAFYLTGGTPLAAFYLSHRYSEDLDFFSETEVDVAALNVFFAESKKLLGFSKIDFQASMNRHLFFLDYPSGTLKMEFTYFPFPRIEIGRREYDIDVDSQIDIAVNKLFTIYQRTKARDYIDLYLLCQQEGYSIDDLVKKARIKFDWHMDPIQLGTQFVKAREAQDVPRMITPIASEEWQQFFIEEAKKLKPSILDPS